MADLRISDAPLLPQDKITGAIKVPTGGEGNYSIQLSDLAWYVVNKENLTDVVYVDTVVSGVNNALQAHIADKANPHQVTKAQVGLDQVDNTADLDKPVSNATRSAIITATADMATKTYVNNRDALKADKAKTLSGYGITDAYTKTETDTKIANKTVNSLSVDSNDVLSLKLVDNTTKSVDLTSVFDNGVAKGIDDVNVKVQQPFTGALSRTQHDKNLEFISVKDFGAKGDSTTDDTIAIQNALNSGAKNIYIPDGTYKMSGNLLINNSNIRFYGSGNATVDYSNKSSKANCLAIYGSESTTLYGVVGSVAKDANSIVLASTPTDISVGDIIALRSDEKDEANMEGYHGELLEVLSVVGDTINLQHKVRRSYTTGKNIKVHKINMLENVTIENIKFIGTGYRHTANGTANGDNGIDAWYVKNITVRDCKFVDVMRNSIRMNSCYGFKVLNNDVTLRKAEVDGQILYGICWLNYASNGLIEGNNIKHGRHGVVHSEDLGYGTSYNVRVVGNTITGTYSAGMATHARLSNVVWANNTIDRCSYGIDIRTENHTVTGNVFTGGFTTIGGIGISLRARAKNITIIGNEFTDFRYAGQFFITADNLAPSNILIANNGFNNCAYGLWFEQNGTANSNNSINTAEVVGLVISNNRFYGGVAADIKLSGYIKGAVISGNTHTYLGTTKNYPVFLFGCQNCTVENEIMHNSFGIGETDVSVKNAANANVVRTSINNVYRNLTGHNHDAGYKLLNMVGSVKNGKFIGQNINVGRDTIVPSNGTFTAECPVIKINSSTSGTIATINALGNDQVVTLRSADNAKVITLKNGTGNLFMGKDIILNSTNQAITLVYNDGLWRLISSGT